MERFTISLCVASFFSSTIVTALITHRKEYVEGVIKGNHHEEGMQSKVCVCVKDIYFIEKMTDRKKMLS